MTDLAIEEISSEKDSFLKKKHIFSEDEVGRLLHVSPLNYAILFFSRILLFLGTIFVHFLAAKTYLSSR